MARHRDVIHLLIRHAGAAELWGTPGGGHEPDGLGLPVGQVGGVGAAAEVARGAVHEARVERRGVVAEAAGLPPSMALLLGTAATVGLLGVAAGGSFYYATGAFDDYHL